MNRSNSKSFKRDHTKFLGLVFDHDMIRCTLIKNLKNKCQQSINFLKMLTNTSWGGNRHNKLMLYRSLIPLRWIMSV